MNRDFNEIVSGFKRVLKLLQRSEKITLFFASLLMLAAGILTNIPALILGRLVDTIVSIQSMAFSKALPFIFLIIGVILIREALTVARKYLIENIATQTEKKQTVRVIEHLLKTDIATILGQQVGSLHGRVFRSIQGLVRMIKLGFLDFLPAIFSAIASLCIAFYQRPLLASIMILVIPTGLFIIVRQIASQKGIRVALLRRKEKIDGAVVEMLGGIETIRVLHTVHNEVAKVEAVAEHIRVTELKHHIAMALYDAAKYLNEGFFYILVISISIYFASTGVITKGDILVYSVLFLSITGPLREIHRILDEAHENAIRVNDLYSLLHEPVDVSFAQPSIVLLGSSTQADALIKVSGLTFAYPQQKDLVILNNINFVIRKGEKVGIVGASGCGKSTLIKILMRLVHGYSGSVQVLGEDLSTINRESLAKQIAYVPQKTYIFSGTIRENIVYGSLEKDISDSRIMEAATFANFHTEIERSLGGLSGRVSENGGNLSGGQRQRLAIARLYLQAPDMLIFDEATSALDNTNESVIQKNIEKVFRSKTILTIAHRLTTLKNSDRILVFDKGSIVQEGSFESLANTVGLFRDFLRQKDASTEARERE